VNVQQGKILTRGHLRIRKMFKTERDKEMVNRQEDWRNDLVGSCIVLCLLTVFRIIYLNWGQFLDFEIWYFYRKSENLDHCLLGKSPVKWLFWRNISWHIYNLYSPAGEVPWNLVDRSCYFPVAGFFTQKQWIYCSIKYQLLKKYTLQWVDVSPEETE